MFSAHVLQSDSIASKAGELQITNSFLLCALGVLHWHKDFVDVRQHKNELDGCIAQAYFREVVDELILKAKQWLVSPLPARQKRGSWLVELISDRDIDQHPAYKAYRHLLHATTCDTPVMRLHLHALEQVAVQSGNVTRMCKKATITESILASFTEDISSEVTLFAGHPRSRTVGKKLS